LSILPQAIWVNYGSADAVTEAILNGTAIAGANARSSPELMSIPLPSLSEGGYLMRKDTAPTPFQNIGGENPPPEKCISLLPKFL